MAKYENIRALAKKQLQTVTESSDRWKEFLRTAAIAYNYSFPNQLLIYAQNPTATAVADMDYWNKNAGRRVKRGAHGTAVFDTRANSPRLRYLFDISDTIPIHEISEALPWAVTDQNWKPVWDKIIVDNHADSTGIISYRIDKNKGTARFIFLIRIKEQLFGSSQYHTGDFIQ